jgi:hypothetical protein
MSQIRTCYLPFEATTFPQHPPSCVPAIMHWCSTLAFTLFPCPDVRNVVEQLWHK